MELTIGIPTYGREGVLIDTLTQVLDVRDPARMEVVVVDQSPEHEPAVADQLRAWEEHGELRYLRLASPSLPAARNTIYREARGRVVMFLDDDMVLPPGLFEAHLAAYTDSSVAAVTGQVFNCLDAEAPPPLNAPQLGTRPHVAPGPAREANNISGGNHSVRREVAFAVGGFDESFVAAALAEDLDFARRLLSSGHRIWYEPAAWVVHLGSPTGGCGIGPATTWPEWTHASGLLLYALRHGPTQGNTVQMLWMALRNGPLRKEVTLRPWRWPVAWAGFLRAWSYARSHKDCVRGLGPEKPVA